MRSASRSALGAAPSTIPDSVDYSGWLACCRWRVLGHIRSSEHVLRFFAGRRVRRRSPTGCCSHQRLGSFDAAGVGVCQTFRSVSYIPVILVTSTSSEELAVEAL